MDESLHPGLADVRHASRTARIAASLFIFICVPLSLWSESYVPRKIFVPKDPVATADHLLSNEFIFRTSIAGHLIGTFIFVLMVLLFHRIFRPVDKHLALLMIIPVMAMIPIAFMLEVFQFTAMTILKTEARPGFDVAAQQEAAFLLLRMERLGASATKMFFGLSFIPLGMLVVRSRFAPRVIGILVIIGGAGYFVDTCIYILLERADYLAVRSYLMYTYFGYMVAFLWFLVKGVRRPESAHAALTAGG